MRACITRGKKDKRIVAFSDNNPEASRAAHDEIAMEANASRLAKEKHKKSGAYIKSMVYGGLDGIITTFAVVAGVAGANLASSTILILGAANLVADGLSMGVGDFLSSKAENDFKILERRRELWECENYLDGEKAEMVDLYISRGMTREDAELVIDVLAKNKQHFVDIMMVEELGIMPYDPSDNPAKDGAITFAAFAIFGLIPLLAYIIVAIVGGDVNAAVGFDLPFILAIILTAITLFALGAITSRFTVQAWWKSGLFTLINGAVAAGAAYAIGYAIDLAVNSGNTSVTN
jgi:VIT1/CCC1 family predicted Fe2+/Mn2+ transporter